MSENTPLEFIGIRPGEKLHELMVPQDDSHLSLEFEDHFVIKPSITFESKSDNFSTNRCSEIGIPVQSNFSYCSKNNPQYLGYEDLLDNPSFLGEDDLVSKNIIPDSKMRQKKKGKVQAIAS